MIKSEFPVRSFWKSLTSIEAALGGSGVVVGSRRRRRKSAARIEPLEIRQLLTGDFESAMRFGSTGVDVGRAIATDAGGNVYTTGYFAGTVDFDPGVGVANLISAGPSDMFVSKLDSVGNFVWARRFGGTNGGDSRAIAVDGSGNVYTTGFFTGTVDFDPGAGVANLLSGAGGSEVFVSKLDSAGNFVWAKEFDTPGRAESYGIAVDGPGNVYTTGLFDGTTDFDPAPAGFANLIPKGSSDIFVSKLDSAGNFVWARGLGGTANDESTGIAVDGVGNVYTTGKFEDTVDFDPGPGVTNLTSVNPTNFDIFVSKLDSAGNFVWARGFGGTSIDESTGIAVDGLGNVYATGYFQGTVDFDPGAGVTSLVSAGGADIFVSKLDSAGNFVWARRFGGTSNDAANDIALDDSGNVYTTGYFEGTADFDPGNSNHYLTSAGQFEIFVSKLDRAGNFAWAQRLGGIFNDEAYGIAIDNTENVFTTGYFTGTADFDPGLGVWNLVSVVGTDIFISKLSPDMLYTLSNGLSGELRLRRNGDMLELWFNGTGTGGLFVLQDTHPINAIRSVRIKGSNTANNKLTVDFAVGGSFVIDEGISYAAGTSTTDVVQLIGLGNEGFTCQPSSTTARSGKFLTYGKEFSFTGVEDTGVSNLLALAIEPQGSADALTVAATSSFSDALGARITGTSGGMAIVPITYDNVQNLTIDTGLKDGLLAQSNDTVTFNAGSMEADGLKNVFVRTGKGNDTLTVNGPDIGLPVPGGAFWFLGGSGIDRLTAIGDANWDLNDIRLVSSGGGRLQPDDVEKASITGGASKNHINASLFSGDATLDGVANNDLLRGGSGNDLLFGGTGNDRIFGSSGDDILYGQDGNDQLWGEAGEDTLYGNAGNDQIWGGDDNDWMSGDAGDDVVMGGSGDDTVNGGGNNDRLFGDAGNDTLTGGAGIDLYDLQGTSNADDLQLSRASATSASFRRKPRGLVTVLELDSITMDASDEFLISALGGDDLIAIDLAFTQLGSVDGGDGIDTCTAPAAWTKVSC